MACAHPPEFRAGASLREGSIAEWGRRRVDAGQRRPSLLRWIM